ncbi:MAG: hypothetical protein IJU41_10145, partial [Clostridia bacterium]|nr:hypothetical protein [Clostridia bacterium]
LLGTSTNPFVNFTDAMQYAAYSATRRAGGVTLHIADSATTGSNYQTPACDYMITITGGTYNLGNRFIQSGPVTFEQIDLRTTAQIVFAARCHKLVIGEGVTTNYAHYLLGGFEQSVGGTVPASGYVTDVTVRSGTWHLVGGGNRYALASAVSGAKTTGSTHLVIGKTNGADTLEITSAIVGLSVNRSASPELLTSATALIEFDGDFTATSADFYPSSYSSSAVAGADYTVDVILRGTCGATTRTYCNTVTALTVYPDLSVDGTGDAADAMVGVYGGTVGSICEYYGTAHVDADTDNACDKCGYTVSFVFEPANVYAKVLQNGRCYLRTIVTAHIPTGKTVEYFGISMVPLSYFTANSMTASDDEAEDVAFFKSTAAIAEGDTFSADLKSIPYEERGTPIYAWVFVKYAESEDVAIYPLGTFTVSGSIYEG